MFKNLNKVGYLPDTENYAYLVLKKFATINSEKKDIDAFLEKIQMVFTKIFGDIKIIDYDVEVTKNAAYHYSLLFGIPKKNLHWNLTYHYWMFGNLVNLEDINFDIRYKEDPYFPEDWLTYQNPKLIPLDETVEKLYENIKEDFPDGIPPDFKFSKNITIPHKLPKPLNMVMLRQIVQLVDEMESHDYINPNNFTIIKEMTKAESGLNIENIVGIFTFLDLINFKHLFITNSVTLPTVLEFFETEIYNGLEDKIVNLFSGSEEGQKLKEIYNSTKYKLGKVHEDEIFQIHHLGIEKSEIFYEDLIKVLMADRLLNNEEEVSEEVSGDGEIPLFEVKER